MQNRVVTALVALLVGLLLGLVGTFGHRSVIGFLGAQLHWGIVVSLLGVACYLAGLRLYTGARLPTLAGAIGVIVPIALFTVQGPGGSVVIAQGFLGEFWELGPAIIAVIVLAWPKLPARAE